MILRSRAHLCDLLCLPTTGGGQARLPWIATQLSPGNASRSNTRKRVRKRGIVEVSDPLTTAYTTLVYAFTDPVRDPWSALQQTA